MSRPNWTEIQDRAAEFAARWQGETYEKGESQTFWSEFLAIFSIDRRRYGAFFEYAIKKGSGKQGFIDLFWPGKLLAEQKSAGKDTREKARVAGWWEIDLEERRGRCPRSGETGLEMPSTQGMMTIRSSERADSAQTRSTSRNGTSLIPIRNDPRASSSASSGSSLSISRADMEPYPLPMR